MSEDKDALDFDLEDGNPDGLESLDAEQIAEESHPYGIVTAEDLGSDELIDDGADPAFWVPDDPNLPTDAELRPHEARNDTGEGETIDEYLAQEEPDPNATFDYSYTEDDEYADAELEAGDVAEADDEGY